MVLFQPADKCKRERSYISLNILPLPAFNFRKHGIYCGESCLIERDKKNPNRWVTAYLVKEMETHQVDEKGKPIKIKDKILKQYKVRADD